MSAGGVELEIGSLLTIDVDAELRKLAQAQIEGPWQLPAELVRRSLRAGAREVRVRIERDGVHVEDDGAPIDRRTLDLLAALLDPGRAHGERHAALIELESRGELALLAIAGIGLGRLDIVTPTGDDAGWLLRWNMGPRDSANGGVRHFAPPAPRTTRVSLRGTRTDRARARAWLHQVARFAPAHVIVDGQAIRHGFADRLVRRELRAPLRGDLSFSQDGQVARLWLLRDGLVVAQLTLPDTPCFEAAIETRDPPTATSSPSSLREAIEPQIPEILDQVVLHLVELGDRAPSLPASLRTRVIQLLLQAARRRVHSAVIARLPLFRGLEIDGGEERFFDLLALRQAVVDEGGDRRLLALFPTQDPQDFTAVGRIFILDEHERGLLHELLDLQFRPPPPRVIPGTSWSRLARSLGDALRTLASELRDLAWLWIGPRHQEVREDALAPAERACLSALRSVAGDRSITLCEGEGRVRRGRGRLALPRRNPEVLRCVAAVARDPAWAYPALLALLGGHEFPTAARRTWSTRAWSR